MDDRDRKALSRGRWQAKRDARAEGRYERAEVFRSPRDYRRKSKYPTNYQEG